MIVIIVFAILLQRYDKLPIFTFHTESLILQGTGRYHMSGADSSCRRSGATSCCLNPDTSSCCHRPPGAPNCGLATGIGGYYLAA